MQRNINKNNTNKHINYIYNKKRKKEKVKIFFFLSAFTKCEHYGIGGVKNWLQSLKNRLQYVEIDGKVSEQRIQHVEFIKAPF